MRLTKRLSISLFLILLTYSIYAQNRLRLSLDDVISLAHERSLDAMVYRNTFLSNYWGFRSFKAEQLPSLNVSMGVGNYSRSLVALQNSETGVISYRDNHNLKNNAELFIKQNIAPTGGTLSLSTSLSRLDQYSPSRDITYYSQPLTLSYFQPLWSYNSFKWSKEIEPLRYERAKTLYLENIEAITVKAVSYFFGYITAQINYELAVQNYSNTKTMYSIAGKRFELGTLKKNDLLQLELQMLNDSLSISTYEVSLMAQRIQLSSFLGYNTIVDFNLRLDDELPEMNLDYAVVLENALKNSSFRATNNISELEAGSAIAKAKANRGVTVSLSAKFGLSQTSETFRLAYQNLLDQEVLGLSISFPIIDWGMGRGRVKVAEAQAEAIKYEIQQEISLYEQDILVKVMQFNNQQRQCSIAKRANEIAGIRYEALIEGFANGTVSVTDLNNGQADKDAANLSFVNQIRNYWTYYYSIRKLSLYDHINNINISTEFDNIINR